MDPRHAPAAAIWAAAPSSKEERNGHGFVPFAFRDEDFLKSSKGKRREPLRKIVSSTSTNGQKSSPHFGATEADGKVVFVGFLGFAFGDDAARTSG